jgi:hypothetical protein
MVRLLSNEKLVEHMKKNGYGDIKEFNEEHGFLPQYFKKEQNTFGSRQEREITSKYDVFKKILWKQILIWDKRYNFNIRDPDKWCKWWRSKNI